MRDLLARYPDEPDLVALDLFLRFWTADPKATFEAVQAELRRKESAAIFGAGAEIALVLARYDDAERLLHRGRYTDADHFLIRRASIAYELLVGEPERAVELATQSLAHNPEEAEIYSLLIESLKRVSRRDEADRLLDEAPEWYRDTSHFHDRRGSRLLRAQNLADAEREYRRAVEIAPLRGDAWEGLAIALQHQAKYQEAESAALEALKHYPREATAYRTLAEIANLRGDSSAGRHLLRRADEAMPVLSGFGRIADANAQIAIGRRDLAITTLQSVASDRNTLAAKTARTLLAQQLISSGRWEEARSVLEEARAKYADDPSLRLSQARLRAHDGDLVAATEMADELLDRPIPFMQAHPYAIEWRFELGDLAEGRRRLENFCRDLPGTPYGAMRLIRMLVHLGRKEDARTLSEAALAKYPDLTKLRSQAIQLDWSQGRYFAAVKKLFRRK